MQARENIIDMVAPKQLMWYGHLQRMVNQRQLKVSGNGYQMKEEKLDVQEDHGM